MITTQSKFKQGDSVWITHKPEDLFSEDFMGHVLGYYKGHLRVRDLNDKIWEVDEEQAEYLGED